MDNPRLLQPLGRSLFSNLVIAISLLLPLIGVARAQVIYTNSSTSGAVSWTTGPNWSATPLSASNTAILFQGELGGTLSITQDTGVNFVLNRLTVANSGAFAMNFTGGAFEFSKSGTTNPVLTFSTVTTTIQTFSNDFVLNDGLSVGQSIATVSNSTIAGVISGAGGLRKAGNGHVFLTGTNNSFGGRVTTSAGTLFVRSIGNAGANSSLGTNGTIALGDGSAINALRTINAVEEVSDKAISLGGSTINTRIENFSGGVLTLNGAINTVTNAGKVLYIVARSNDVVLGGSIATTNAANNNLALYLTNSSTNTLILTASNDFRGGVTVQSGNLSVSNSAALGSGAVTFLTNTTLTALASVNLTNNISVATGMTVAVTTPQSAGLTNQISGEVSGAGGLRINTAGATTYLANANNSFGGGVHVQQGEYVVASVGNAGGNSSLGTNGTVKLGNNTTTGILQWLGAAAETTDKVFDLAGTTGGGIINASGTGLFKITENLSTSGSGAKTLTLSGSGSGEFAGTIGNSGGGNTALTKSGAGTWTLSGANNYSGATTVGAGTLELANTTGQALSSTVSVAVGATAALLLSESDQVNNNATVSLSGGTITRASGVSEVFGNLNVAAASFIDFASGTAGSLRFGTYARDTDSALLTVQNFFQGNSLVFSQNLVSAGFIDSSSSGSYNNGYFAFGDGFTTTWNGTDTFTITAIPEPTAYAAAVGLLLLCLFSRRKRGRSGQYPAGSTFVAPR